jgi:hypothetical protein
MARGLADFGTNRFIAALLRRFPLRIIRTGKWVLIAARLKKSQAAFIAMSD